MERKIGETFEFDGKTLQVKAANDDGCEDCIFNVKCTRGIKSVTGLCESIYRDDKKDVIFVEVKERKIGEVFESRGKKLKVTEHRSDCVGCFFDGQFKSCLKEETGECGEYVRSDHKSVIFVEVKDEQQQEQAEQPQAEQPQTEQPPQKLNLCEILKHCPQGEPFWSPMMGDVKLHNVDHEKKRIYVILKTGIEWYINADATLTTCNVTSEEIMLYPSREQRDWSKVKYEPKKELPRTWEEFCITHNITMSEYFIGETGNIFNSNSGARIPEISKTILPSEQAAEAHLAYMQLHQLRDAWREGWMPDWNGFQGQYIIYNYKGKFTTGIYYNVSRFLSFQDEKRAKEFLECFRYLIEKAGDLI